MFSQTLLRGRSLISTRALTLFAANGRCWSCAQQGKVLVTLPNGLLNAKTNESQYRQTRWNNRYHGFAPRDPKPSSRFHKMWFGMLVLSIGVFSFTDFLPWMVNKLEGASPATTNNEEEEENEMQSEQKSKKKRMGFRERKV